jgi:hypothetical protein
MSDCIATYRQISLIIISRVITKVITLLNRFPLAGWLSSPSLEISSGFLPIPKSNRVAAMSPAISFRDTSDVRLRHAEPFGQSSITPSANEQLFDHRHLVRLQRAAAMPDPIGHVFERCTPGEVFGAVVSMIAVQVASHHTWCFRQSVPRHTDQPVNAELTTVAEFWRKEFHSQVINATNLRFEAMLLLAAAVHRLALAAAFVRPNLAGAARIVAGEAGNRAKCCRHSATTNGDTINPEKFSGLKT